MRSKTRRDCISNTADLKIMRKESITIPQSQTSCDSPLCTRGPFLYSAIAGCPPMEPRSGSSTWGFFYEKKAPQMRRFLCLCKVWSFFMQKTCDFQSSLHKVCYQKPMCFLQSTDLQRKIHCRIFLYLPNKALLQGHFLRLAYNKSSLMLPVKTEPRQTYQKSRYKWYLETDCCSPG